jgi:hypothetical protein
MDKASKGFQSGGESPRGENCLSVREILKVHMTTPQVYTPALWIYNRAIVQEKVSRVEFMIRGLRFGESRETTTAELVLVSDLNPDLPYQGLKLKLSIAELEEQYEPTGKRVNRLL